MGESNQFRTATFGGFHRQDVMNYLTTSAVEHEQMLTALQTELTQLRESLSEQETRGDTLDAKLAAAEASGIALQSALEASEVERAQTTDRLLLCQAELNDVRSDANELVATLRAEILVLEPKAQAFDKLKERSAGIELDAHRRAQGTLDDAERDAIQLRSEQARILREAQLRYELLRESLRESCARSRVELDEMREGFERITRDFDGYEDTLADLLAQAEEGLDADSLKKLAALLR